MSCNFLIKTVVSCLEITFDMRVVRVMYARHESKLMDFWLDWGFAPSRAFLHVILTISRNAPHYRPLQAYVPNRFGITILYFIFSTPWVLLWAINFQSTIGYFEYENIRNSSTCVVEYTSTLSRSIWLIDPVDIKFWFGSNQKSIRFLILDVKVTNFGVFNLWLSLLIYSNFINWFYTFKLVFLQIC